MGQSPPQHSQDDSSQLQPVQNGPNAQVQCILHNDGEWMLRTYSNENGFEYIKLERLHGAQHVVRATKGGNGTSMQEIRNGVLLKPSRVPKQRTNDLDRNSNSPGKEGSFDSSSQQSQGSETFVEKASRKVRLHGDSTTPYDPNTVREEDQMEAKHVPPPKTLTIFKGTVTSGWDRPCFGDKGEWCFQPAGGTDTDQSSETIAALEMGGQGLFSPDTNRPTAEEVHNYKKCHKQFGNGTLDRSRNVDVVWIPDSEKEARQRAEANSTTGQDTLRLSTSDAVSGSSPAKRQSKPDETPVSPRSNLNRNETSQEISSNNGDDFSKLMPPPGTPFDPTNNSARKPRTSNASASTRRSSARGITREDTPQPDNTSAKRKSSEAGSISGSPPKTLKLGTSTNPKPRTSWPSKNSLGSLKIFDKGSKKLSFGTRGGDTQSKADSSTETVGEESEAETGTKEDNEEKKKEQDRLAEKEAGEDSEE